ncbi:MAG: MFS transporter [Pseudomonadota bacterium]
MSPAPLIFAAVMAHGMGQTIVFAVLAPLGREVGLAAIEVGLIITLSSIVFSWASPRWGRASEHLGRRRTLIIGLLGYTLGTTLFATGFLAGREGWLTGTSLLVVLILARMFQSTLMAAAPPAATAYMADITSAEQRTTGMGKLGAANNVGTIIGPAVGGALAMISLLAPLYGAAAVTLVTAFFVWRLLPESPQGTHAAHLPATGAADALDYFDPRIFPFLLLGVSLYIGFSVIQQTLGFFIQDRLHIDGRETAKWVGMALMVSAAASLATQAMAIRFDWRARRLLWTGLPAMLAGSVVLTLASGPWLVALAMALIGSGVGLAAPGYTAAASMAVSAREQGAVAGLLAAAPALGYIIGPLAGTALYQLHSHAPHLFVAILFVPLLFYLKHLDRRLP